MIEKILCHIKGNLLPFEKVINIPEYQEEIKILEYVFIVENTMYITSSIFQVRDTLDNLNIDKTRKFIKMYSVDFRERKIHGCLGLSIEDHRKNIYDYKEDSPEMDNYLFMIGFTKGKGI